MKFRAVLLAIMFGFVTSAWAQVRQGRPGFHGGHEVFRGVNPGFRPSAGIRPPFRSFPRQNVVIAPQVPLYSYYPYYSYDPYYPGFYYSQPVYSSADQSSGIAQINSLNDQIQRLQNEVDLLQDELATARAQQAQPSPLQVTPATPPAPVVPTVLIFQDGHRIETQGYAIVGQTLWTSYQDGFKKIPLSDLNLAATRRENLKRGINFLPER